MKRSQDQREKKGKSEVTRRLTVAIVFAVAAGVFAVVRILPVVSPKSDIPDSVSPGTDR
jgi:hypothetical protein